VYVILILYYEVKHALLLLIKCVGNVDQNIPSLPFFNFLEDILKLPISNTSYISILKNIEI